MIRGFNTWGTKIMDGVMPEPRPGWNAELTKVAAEYRARNYSRNENGFVMRNAGKTENMLLAMSEQTRTEFGAFLKTAFRAYIENLWGGNVADITDPLFASGSAHTDNCEPSFAHVDHGCQLVIAYFCEAHLEEEKHQSAGNFVAFDPKFPSAFQMGGAAKEPMMFMHRPQVGSFVVYPPDAIHQHAPTFSETSRRTVIDTFVNFSAKGRHSRVSTAITLP